VAAQLLRLQRTAGNQAVVRLFGGAPSAPGASVIQRDEDPNAPADDPAAEDLMVVPEGGVEFTPDPDVMVDDGDGIVAIPDSSGMGDFPIPNPEEMAAAPPAAISFVNGGRSRTVRWGDAPQDDGLCPHAFTAGGMTGTVTWGPAGAKGNQPAGSIQGEVSPVYQAQAPVPHDAGPPDPAKAWVQNGTGTMQVTRSYTGVNSGNQGNGYFVTAAAAARINQHEVGHVNLSSGFHNSDLKPVLDNILGYTQAQAGRGTGANQAAAITALQTTLNMPAGWNTAKTNFASHDTAANTPGGSWDTTELASGTYIVDIGPGTVAGNAYTHRIKTPGEPVPA